MKTRVILIVNNVYKRTTNSKANKEYNYLWELSSGMHIGYIR